MKYQIGDFVSYGGLTKGIVIELDRNMMSIHWMVEENTKKPQWYYQTDTYVKKLETK
jgi:hypothetical protein